MLDQVVSSSFTRSACAAEPAAGLALPLGTGTIGALDMLIAGIGITSAALLYAFLRYTKLGWAVRATAQDRDAAHADGRRRQSGQPGRVCDRRRRLAAFPACWWACTTTRSIRRWASRQRSRAVVAELVGGAGNVPGAIVGSLLLGLIESYGVALFGTSYRNLFAFLILIVVLVCDRTVCSASAKQAAARAAHRHFHGP